MVIGGVVLKLSDFILDKLAVSSSAKEGYMRNGLLFAGTKAFSCSFYYLNSRNFLYSWIDYRRSTSRNNFSNSYCSNTKSRFYGRIWRSFVSLFVTLAPSEVRIRIRNSDAHIPINIKNFFLKSGPNGFLAPNSCANFLGTRYFRFNLCFPLFRISNYFSTTLAEIPNGQGY